MMKILRYCPAFNEVTGGVNATLLMMQLEFWFDKNEGNSFFKFLEPCGDAHYKAGDSWREELGFSKGEFRTAFSRIGKVYKSKREFDASQDKFEGKMYLSYFDRVKRLTFYMRNDEVVNQVLQEVGEPAMPKEEKLPTRGVEDTICRSEELDFPISIDYSLDSTKEYKQESSHLVPYEQIIAAYHTTCQELPRVETLSEKLKERINQVWERVGGEMRVILEMLEKVRESDFLNGRVVGKFWKASLSWMMQVEKFEAILRDKYAVRSREKQVKKFNRMASHNWDFDQLEALEQAYIMQKSEEFKMLKSPLMAKVEDRARW